MLGALTCLKTPAGVICCRVAEPCRVAAAGVAVVTGTKRLEVAWAGVATTVAGCIERGVQGARPALVELETAAAAGVHELLRTGLRGRVGLRGRARAL